jgi:long-chain acyl-CoA synthetase
MGSGAGAPFTLRDTLLRARDLYRAEPAVVCGERVLDWGELARRTNGVGAWLAAAGVGRGDRVVVISDNRPEVAEVAYALAQLAAVMVPLSPIVAPAEAAGVWADAEAKLALVAPGLEALVAGLDPVLEIGGAEYEEAAAAGGEDELPFVEQPEDVVLQFYTSGTTGRPKGVLMSQRALLFNGFNTVLSQGLRHGDVFLTCTPITHAAGGTRIFSLATEGIEHVLLPRWSTEAFFAEVARRGVTSTVLMPAMLGDVCNAEGREDADLETLRLIVYGGSPTPKDVQRAALERLDAGLLHSYGISEGCPALTVLTPADHERALADPGLAARLDSVGRPVPGVRFRIVGEDGAILPPRETGEVLVRNVKVTSGYWHRAEQEAELWRDGWMGTGDLGYVDEEGFLYLVGRRRELIISGGFNIYPVEVENALSEHPAVAEVAVVGLPHPRWGEAVTAFVVAAEPVDGATLDAHCRQRLSRYKLPKAFHFLDRLPRNELGKVTKRELAQIPNQEGGEE